MRDGGVGILAQFFLEIRVPSPKENAHCGMMWPSQGKKTKESDRKPKHR